MQIISILLFLSAIYFYLKRKNAELLLCLTAILNSCFGILPAYDYVTKPENFIFLFSIFVTVCGFFRNKRYLSIRQDWIAKIIIIILVYVSIECIYTIIFIDHSTYPISTIKIHFILLLYFYFRKQPVECFKRYFYIALIPSVIQGIFFYLQVVGVDGILVGRVDEAVTASDSTRYANFPGLAFFYVFYFVFSKKYKMSTKVFMVCFFAGMPLLGQFRNDFANMALAFIIFFIIYRKAKYAIYMVIGYIAFATVVVPVLSQRTKGTGNSTLDDVKEVFSGNIYNIDVRDGGTFTFRIAMLGERWMYLEDHPENIPFGIGALNDFSPANHLYFDIATENDAYPNGKCIIESGDITWVPILLRYGLVGSFIMLSLLIVWIMQGIPMIKKINDPLFTVIALMGITTTTGSFITTVFDTATGNFNLALNLAVLNSFLLAYKRFGNRKIVNRNTLI